MNISIVIPTLDNPDDVANVIESLNLQSLLPSEIVIVDQRQLNSAFGAREKLYCVLVIFINPQLVRAFKVFF